MPFSFSAGPSEPEILLDDAESQALIQKIFKVQPKTAEDFRDMMLQDYANQLRLEGVTNPNIGPGSDAYKRYSLIGACIEYAVAYNTSQILNIHPLTASGSGIDLWLKALHLPPRRDATSSVGNVIFSTSSAVPTAIVVGSQLIDPNGNLFSVFSTNSYSDGDLIAIVSEAKGKSTNLDPGTIMKWVSAIPFADTTCVLDRFGTHGGAEPEDDETARSRIVQKLGGSSSAGNAGQYQEWAESALSRAQKAFVYDAANGPSTIHIAVAGYATASDIRSRQLSNFDVATIQSYLVGKATFTFETVVTACEDLPADVTFLLQIPQSAAAIPFGTGGGWIDANPFPTMQGLTQKFCDVSAVTNTTKFRISNCSVFPQAGQSICYIDKTNFKLYTGKIVAFSIFPLIPPPYPPPPYAFDIEVDTPFLNIQVGDYIFPAAENMQTYVDAVLNEFANLGPGEKTDQAGLLPQAYRQPRAFEAWDYALGPKFLKAIVNSGKEVYDAEWGYQNSGLKIPPLPSVIKNPPKIFVPWRIAFYPMS